LSAVSVKNVSIAYAGKRAVNGVSFELCGGDYLAIVGENGSGKSTLVRGIIGLLPLESGSVIFSGGKKETGYLPQQTKVRQDFPASVGEVVLSGRAACLGVSPFFSKEDKRIANLYMDRLGIAGFKGRPYSGLSGGEQRRVLLARAFCAARDLLVLDEPTAGLDSVIAAEFYRLLREFREYTRATVIMVSHDVDAAIANAGKILHIESGVKFFGTSEEYVASGLSEGFSGCRHG